MARLGRTAGAVLFCLASSACEEDGVQFARLTALPMSGDAGSMEDLAGAGPSASGNGTRDVSPGSPAPPANSVPVNPLPAGVPPPAPGAEPADPDAGLRNAEPDASPPRAVARPIVVEGAAVDLARIGVAGGDPRLGVCRGGVLIGVRTTANPSQEVFGQRLVFVEPICGQLVQTSAEGRAEPVPSTTSVTRVDSILGWATTDPFVGLPATEVPDSRLTWELQPPTVCPETTPVVVGLSGEYDPVAPDATDTSAIRSLFIECAPLALAPNGTDVVASESGHLLISNADSFAVAGSTPYRASCEGGRVATQITVHAGFWLDGFVLGCSSLRLE